jgi:hypothetical protein
MAALHALVVAVAVALVAGYTDDLAGAPPSEQQLLSAAAVDTAAPPVQGAEERVRTLPWESPPTARDDTPAAAALIAADVLSGSADAEWKPREDALAKPLVAGDDTNSGGAATGAVPSAVTLRPTAVDAPETRAPPPSRADGTDILKLLDELARGGEPLTNATDATVGDDKLEESVKELKQTMERTLCTVAAMPRVCGAGLHGVLRSCCCRNHGEAGGAGDARGRQAGSDRRGGCSDGGGSTSSHSGYRRCYHLCRDWDGCSC